MLSWTTSRNSPLLQFFADPCRPVCEGSERTLFPSPLGVLAGAALLPGLGYSLWHSDARIAYTHSDHCRPGCAHGPRLRHEPKHVLWCHIHLTECTCVYFWINCLAAFLCFSLEPFLQGVQRETGTGRWGRSVLPIFRILCIFKLLTSFWGIWGMNSRTGSVSKRAARCLPSACVHSRFLEFPHYLVR